MSPPTATSVCSPLPSGGSRLPPVPHLRRYYGVVRLLSARPGRLRSPSTARYLPLNARSFPWPGHPSQPGPGPLRQACHACLVRKETRGLPGSWGIPVNACPGLGTPAAPNDLALSVVRMLSSARLTASTAATVNDFGAAPSRPASSRPTLHPRPVARREARLASGLPATALTGLDLHQLDPIERFPSAHLDFPLSQAWPGAIT